MIIKKDVAKKTLTKEQQLVLLEKARERIRKRQEQRKRAEKKEEK